MPAKDTKPAAIEAAIEPEPTKPASALTPYITFGEVANLLGVYLNVLTEWAGRGLLPSPEEQTSHPHHWRWSRDAMTRWCDAMKSELAKAQKSRL